MSLLVLQRFVSGFRGSDERTRCTAAALAARRRQSMRGDIQSIRTPTKRDAHGRHYSTVTPLALIGPAHFSISLLRNCAVGTSGNAFDRSLVMIAMPFTVPPSICGLAVLMISHK